MDTDTSKARGEKAKEILEAVKAGQAGPGNTYIYETGKENQAPVAVMKRGETNADILNATETGATIYKDKAGNFSTTPSVSIGLNEETGKITITAPSVLTKTDAYKEQIKPLLDDASSNYKTDKNFKYLDQDGETTYSVQEQLSRIEKSLNEDYIPYAIQMQAGKEAAKSEYNLELNDKNYELMNTTAITRMDAAGNMIAPKDTDLQSIPESVFTGEQLARFTEYNEESGVTTRKDIMENFYNRAKTSKEEILDVFGKAKDLANNEEADPAERAKAISLMNFLYVEHPEVGFWEATGDFFGAVITGVEQTGGDILDIFFNKEWHEQYVNWKEQYDLEQQLTEGGLTQGIDEVSSLVAALAVDIFVTHGLATAAKIAASTAVRVARGISAGGKVLAGAKRAREIKVATGIEAAKVSLTSAKTLSVEKKVESLDNAAESILLTAGAKNGAKIVNSVIKLDALAKSGKALTSIGKASATLLRDTFVALLVFKPEIYRELLHSGNLSDEAKREVYAELGSNALFAGSFFGISKGIKVLGDTTTGQAISANFSRRMAKALTKAGGISDKVRITLTRDAKTIEDVAKKLDEKDAKRGLSRGQAFRERQILRMEYRELAEMDAIKWLGKDEQEIKKLLEPVQKKITEIRKVSNAIDDHNAGCRNTINGFLDKNKEVNAAEEYRAVTDNFNKVIDAEKNTRNDLFKSATGRKNIKGDVGVKNLLSDATANYIGATRTLARWQTQLKKAGKTMSKEKRKLIDKSIDEAKAQIKLFRESATPELIEATDNLISSLKAYYYKIEDVYKFYGIENIEELEGLRGSGFFGEEGKDYYRVQRKTELELETKENMAGMYEQKSEIKPEHEVMGATGDYADPMLTIQSNLYTHAKLKNHNDILKALNVGTREQDAIYLTGVETQFSRNMSAKWGDGTLRTETDKNIKSYTKEFFEKIEKKDTLKNMLKIKTAKSSQLTAEAEKTAAELEKAKIEKKEFKSTPSTKAKTLASISGRDLDSLYNKYVGIDVDSAILDKAGYEAFLSSLPLPTQKMVVRAVEKFADMRHPRMAVANRNSFKVYNEMIAADQTFTRIIKQDLLSRNKEAMADKKFVDRDIAEQRNAKLAKVNTVYKKSLGKVEKLAKELDLEADKEALVGDIKNLVDDFTNGFSGSHASVKMLDSMANVFEVENNDVFRGYVSLRAMMENEAEFNKLLSRSFENQFNSILARKPELRKKYSETELKARKDRLYNEYQRMVNDTVLDEYGKSYALIKEISPELADTEGFYNKLDEISERITGVKSEKHLVYSTDSLGRDVWMKTNPLIADFLNMAYRRPELNWLENGLYIINRIFRLGTTGALGFASWTNQLFRDGLSAYVGGGMHLTMQNAVKQMVNEFGDDLVDYVYKYEGEVFKRIAKESEKELTKAGKLTDEALDQEIKTRLAKRELQMQEPYLRAMERTQSEGLMKEFAYTKYINAEQVKMNRTDRWRETIDRSINGGIFAKLDKPNQIREKYYRSKVYRDSFQQALKHGMTVGDARIYAENLMRNATTNFGRKMVSLASLQRTTPYLAAAINGTRSFWRLASLDPVGVFGRMINGLVLPTVALTVNSLGTEENRNIWKNLKEYQKDDALVFILDGQLFSIPLPQEISAMVAPFRQMVEEMYDSNRHDFWELALNDALGFSPIDIAGFYDVDQSDILTDTTIWDRLERGATKLAAQLLDPVSKSAVISWTGYDPYTGKKVNTANEVYDDETGDTVIMDYNTSEFARWFHEVFEDIPASQAAAIFKGLLGKGGLTGLDSLTNLCRLATGNSERGYEFGDIALKGVIGSMTSPLTVELYNGVAEREFNSAISELYAKREQLVASSGYQDIIRAYNSATTEEARTKAYKAYMEKLNQFYSDTLDVVNAYTEKYSASFDQTKLAKVISLLNFESTATTLGNKYIEDMNDDEKAEAKRLVVDTMIRFGFKAEGDSSIFGKEMYNKYTGETYHIFASPLAITDAKSSAYYAGNVHLANIEAIIKGAKLTSSDRYKFIESATKSGMSKKQAYSEWNKKVITALAPYFNEYNAASVVESSAVVDYLDNTLSIPYGSGGSREYIKKLYKEAK